MIAFILDTNIIIWAPQVITRQKQNYELIIPSSIVKEINFASNDFPSFKEKIQLIKDSEKQGLVKILPISDLQPSSRSLNPADSFLIGVANSIKNNYDEIYIVTSDHFVIKEAEKQGLRTLNKIQFDQYYKISNTPSSSLKNTAEKIKSKDVRYYVFSFISGIISTIIFSVVWTNSTYIISTINVWGTIIVIIFLSILFYMIRGRYILYYAIVEITFGMLTSIFVFYPDFKLTTLDNPQILQIIAGLYISVRGQDNLEKYLKYTKLNNLWQRYSGTK